MYRMPTHFGPAPGPRQGPEGERFNCRDSPQATTVSVSFLTHAARLAELLPEHFELASEPVVTVSASYLTEVEWLAGRGYNLLGVSFPAHFRGGRDEATGSFLAVLWENLADPIITGREELGFAKIYCELPDPTVLANAWHLSASWLGFRFLDVYVTDLTEQSADEIADLPAETGDGILHYKYVPRTGAWGEADVCHACLTPAPTPNQRIQRRWVGSGAVEFHAATWEQMPTQFNIVNALHDLEVLEYRSAFVSETRGGKDLRDQRILL